REQRMNVVAGALKRQLQLARRRLTDAEKALRGTAEAERLRSEADLLLAYVHQIDPAMGEAALTDFGGQPVQVTLDPRLDVAGNARARYDQARRREARAARAASQLPELQAAAAELAGKLDGLPKLTDEELLGLVEEVG